MASISLSRNHTNLMQEILRFRILFLIQRQAFRKIQTRDRVRLERIHKKRQDVIERSRQALENLRRKKLEGLTVLPKDYMLQQCLKKANSIRRLIYLYNNSKGSEALTLSNQVTTLSLLAHFYDKHRNDRKAFTYKFNRKSLDEIIISVSTSCNNLSPNEIVDVVVGLSQLWITEEQKYSPFLREIKTLGLKAFTSDNLAMLAFAFGNSKNRNSLQLMKEIETELLCRPLISFSHSALSEIAWSFVELDIPADKLLDGVCTEVLSRDVSLFTSRDIALIALAFSRVESLGQHVSQALHDSLYSVIETLKFPTRDIVAVTVALLRSGDVHSKMFTKLDAILVSRRDFEEKVPKKLLEEFFLLLKGSRFHSSETRKVIENVLHPHYLNSVFDVLFRPRISWKAKVFKQSYFKVY